MNHSTGLMICQTDFDSLSSLLLSESSQTAQLLEEELTSATIVPDEDLPDDVVSMKSEVVYKDLESGKESRVTLVYPHEADVEQSKVSVLAPVGAALIGLKVGQEIPWPMPTGKVKHIQVMAVSRSAP